MNFSGAARSYAVIVCAVLALAPVLGGAAPDARAQPTSSAPVGSQLTVTTGMYPRMHPFMVEVIAPGVGVATTDIDGDRDPYISPLRPSERLDPGFADVRDKATRVIKDLRVHESWAAVIDHIPDLLAPPSRALYTRADGSDSGLRIVIVPTRTHTRMTTEFERTDGINGIGSVAMIRWPVRQAIFYRDPDGALKVLPDSVAFAHEFVHALHANAGAIASGSVRVLTPAVIGPLGRDAEVAVARDPWTVSRSIEEVYTHGGPLGIAVARGDLDVQGRLTAMGLTAADLPQSDTNPFLVGSARAASERAAAATANARPHLEVVARVRRALVSQSITELRAAAALNLPTRSEYVSTLLRSAAGDMESDNFLMQIERQPHLDDWNNPAASTAFSEIPTYTIADQERVYRAIRAKDDGLHDELSKKERDDRRANRNLRLACT